MGRGGKLRDERKKSSVQKKYRGGYCNNKELLAMKYIGKHWDRDRNQGRKE